MRRRWARLTLAVFLSAACSRDGRGTEPPRSDEPPIAAATEPEPEPVAGAPAPSAAAGETTDPPPGPASPEPAPPSPSSTLRDPTEEEFRAWDRPDPEQEAKLDAWDREHLAALLRTYDELRCFHKTLLAAGERRLGQGGDEARWTTFERDWVVTLDEWLMKWFADNERILEKSRFAGHFLEAHEILMHTYVEAYDARDRGRVEKTSEQWLAVEGKVRKRAEKLGGKLSTVPTRCEPPAKK